MLIAQTPLLTITRNTELFTCDVLGLVDNVELSAEMAL